MTKRQRVLFEQMNRRRYTFRSLLLALVRLNEFFLSRHPVHENLTLATILKTLISLIPYFYRSTVLLFSHLRLLVSEFEFGLNVISTVKPTRCTNVSNLFHFGMTLYMFRTVFPPIIRISRRYVQQQAYVKQILLSAG